MVGAGAGAIALGGGDAKATDPFEGDANAKTITMKSGFMEAAT
jgi:hypothetical protein